MIPYQILLTNIIRTVWQTVRRITNEILGVGGLKKLEMDQFYSFFFVTGFIRVGSRVWGKALNGDFYKGVVTGLGEMLHIKFDNGDTIAHDRTDPECVVFDQVPEISDLEIGKNTFNNRLLILLIE